MTFVPVVPSGGLAGWAVLQRTMDRQKAALTTSPAIERETAYFRENIGKVRSVDDLMSDYRLLSVSLGAFGLSEDLPNRFFIRRVLEDGTQAPDALANRLSDKRYFALAETFGFGDLIGAKTTFTNFADEIVELYETRSFEAALGQSQPNLRLALAFEREMEQAAENVSTEEALWFTIMATPPLRSVFEGAFGLPTAFGAIDLDQQLRVFRERSDAMFGTSDPRDFLTPETREEITRRFLATADLQAATSPLTPGSVALTLLSGAAG